MMCGLPMLDAAFASCRKRSVISRSLRHVGAQHLDRDPLVDDLVAGEVDDAHPAFAEQPLDLVAVVDGRADVRIDRSREGRNRLRLIRALVGGDARSARVLLRHCDGAWAAGGQLDVRPAPLAGWARDALRRARREPQGGRFRGRRNPCRDPAVLRPSKTYARKGTTGVYWLARKSR